MKRYNIRMAGIGGQGVVTASHVLSNGVIIAGGESTLVPFFGSEKRMAPVESYVRVAEGRIFEIGEIIYPNVIMIFHTQVITHGKSYTMPFYSGLKDEGVVLINSEGQDFLYPGEQAGRRNRRNRAGHQHGDGRGGRRHHRAAGSGLARAIGERAFPGQGVRGVRRHGLAG
jgi:pyruvate ferredoxin oxidoreductase gamma subunit